VLTALFKIKLCFDGRLPRPQYIRCPDGKATPSLAIADLLPRWVDCCTALCLAVGTRDTFWFEEKLADDDFFGLGAAP
jgi:hypothetical protein